MFPEPFRERIRNRKYCSWAADLTEDQLEALLWALGEYGYRADNPLRILHQHSPMDPIYHARAVLALEVLADFTHGKPITPHPLCERIRQVAEDTRRAHY